MLFCFKGKTDTDQLKRICKGGGDGTRRTPAEESMKRCVSLGRYDDYTLELFVCQKVNTSIWKNADQTRRVAFEKCRHPMARPNMTDSLDETIPTG